MYILDSRTVRKPRPRHYSAHLKLINPTSVVEIGCGTGVWLAEMQKHGVRDIVAIDGPWIRHGQPHIPSESLLRHDLKSLLALPRNFDLVLCLGVADHLPVSSAETLVATLTGLGPIVLFCPRAAGPCDNSLPSGSWDDLFASRGYQPHRGFVRRFGRDIDQLDSRDLVFYADPGVTKSIDLDLRYLEGPSQAVSLERIQPVVMTCALAILYLTEQFVASYEERVGSALPAPVVSVDLTAGTSLPDQYLGLLDRLRPVAVTTHPRLSGATDFESINDAAYAALESGLRETNGCEDLLFIEDDVLFSSKLIEFLSGLRLEPDTGLYTLYQPFSGYGSTVIPSRHFFGTQCLVLPCRAAKEILADRHKGWLCPTLTYDLRWTRSLSFAGYKLYGAIKSYVQHVGIVSRYGSGAHRSDTFVE